MKYNIESKVQKTMPLKVQSKWDAMCDAKCSCLEEKGRFQNRGEEYIFMW